MAEEDELSSGHRNLPLLMKSVRLTLRLFLSLFLNQNDLHLKPIRIPDKYIPSILHYANRKMRKYLRISLVEFVWIISCSFIIGRLIFICFTQLNYARLVGKWKPEVANGANHTEKCARKSDLVEPDPELRDYIHKTHEYLRSWGVIQDEYGDLYAFLILYLCIYCLALGSWHNYRGPRYAYSLLFYFKPLCERNRIESRLKDISEDLIERSNPSGFYNNKHHISTSRIASNPNRLISSSMRLKPIADRGFTFNRSKFNLSYRERPTRINSDETKFIFLILDYKLWNLVRPANLSYRGFKMIESLTLCYAFVDTFIGVLIPSVFVYHYFWLNMCAVLERRLDILGCELWKPDATLIFDSYLLRPWNSDMHRNLYLNYSKLPSFSTKFKIVRWELSSNLTEEFSHHMLEALLLYGTISLVFYLQLLVFCLNTDYLSMWLDQVIKQMSDSVKLMRLNQHYEYLRSSRLNPKDNRRLAIEKSLTVVYLNFELFRREYQNYKNYTSHLVIRISTLAFFSSLSSYLFVVMISHKRAVFVWTLNMYVIFIYNYMVSKFLLLFHKIEKTYRSINEIMAESSNNSLNRSWIIQLWRRQLLSKSGVSDQYCMPVYGINLTASSLIASNSYFFALWLFMSKSAS